MSIHQSAKKALRILLDEAEARDWDPPANGEVVAELEWIIANTKNDDDCYPITSNEVNK